MNPLTLLPLWAKALFVAALLAAAAWAVHVYNEHFRDQGRAEVQAKWDRERDKQKDAAIQQAAVNAKETQRRLDRQQEAQRAHDTELARAEADAARATAAAGRLSTQLAAFTAAARRAPGNPAPAGIGTTAGVAPIDVLADLFRAADETAGVLALALDRSRAAGLQCERTYDALTVKP